MTPGHLLGLRLPTDVPVVPDGPTARRWAEEELLDPIYHEGPNLLQELLDWLLELLDGTSTGLGVPTPAAALLALLVVAVVATVVLLVAGPVRRRRRSRATGAVFVDDHRTAAELRAAAEQHLRAGRWSDAVLDRFRAIVRALEERALLDERPGRTAHEAVTLAGARLPDLEADLARAGALFDDTCYGGRPAAEEDARWIADLDSRVARTRPVLDPAVGSAAMAGAGAAPGSGGTTGGAP